MLDLTLWLLAGSTGNWEQQTGIKLRVDNGFKLQLCHIPWAKFVLKITVETI